MRNKRGLEIEMLGWWIIGIVVLVISIIAITIMSGKADATVDFLKNLLRFGR